MLLEECLPPKYKLKKVQAVVINKKLHELWIKSNFKLKKEDLVKLCSDETFLEQFSLGNLTKNK